MHWELVKLRNEHNLSKKQMAEILGIHPESYAAKEKGEGKFNIEEMFKLRFLFNTPLEEIFLPSDFAKLEVKEMETK